MRRSSLARGSFFHSVAQERQSSRKLADGFVLRLESKAVRLQVCDGRTIRVMVSLRPTLSFRPSLVVNKTWMPTRWQLRDHDGEVVVSTDRMSARLDLRTGTVAFSDAGNRSIVQEHPTSAHEMVPATVAGEQTYHVTQRFLLSSDEGIYGLGQFEHGVMNYRNHNVTLIQNNRHIVLPFIVSSRAYGIYWDNYSHTEFHGGPDGMSFWSEVADGIDYYLISGSNIDDVIAGYRNATGGTPMFPKWAFGYWQSKERYENQHELLDVAREYRQRKIPIDNVVQDWMYWGSLGWNAMAFDPARYPDPKGMIDSLHQIYNIHVMVSIWPQVDSSTAVHRELQAGGHLFPTEIWNGGKTYDAYSNDARRIYWDHLNKGLYSLGVDAWWVDATEPDWKWCDSLLEEKAGIVRNGITALGSSSRYLNTYALMATGGIYENQRKTNPDRRVVMLTRSAFAGQQRNSAAVWSGDISSTWQTFRNQIAAGVNFSMAGIPYWNSDIGGFLPKEYGGEYPKGPRDPSYRELYVRWFQFGAFCPIFRAHGTDFPHEVWRFGEPGSWAYDALVKFIHLRYRLLPYIYSVAWMVTKDHSTIMRGLPMDFPHDPRARTIGDEYLFGPAILVAPVTTQMYYPKNPPVVIPSNHLRTPDDQPGLIGEYFKGMRFEERAHAQRDTAIRFDWTERGAPGVGKEKFSVKWKGRLLASGTGTYEIEAASDGGVNLFIDNRQIMDEMYPAGRQRNIGEIALEGKKWYDVTFEYYQERERAEVELTWRTPSMITGYKPRSETGTARVYLPESSAWYDFWTGERLAGGKEVEREAPIEIMPLYVRAGSIIPFGPTVQYATEKHADPIELRVYRGANGRFTFYEDENDGYRYEQGIFATIQFRWNEVKQTLTIGRRRGSFPGMLKARTFSVVAVRAGRGIGADPDPRPDRVVRYNGEQVTISLDAK